MLCIGALREGNPELGVWEGIRDPPALALKFGPRPWEKTSAPGCPVHLFVSCWSRVIHQLLLILRPCLLTLRLPGRGLSWTASEGAVPWLSPAGSAH